MNMQNTGSPSGDIILKARNITRKFGGLVAVSDLSFDIHSGEILGLIGPNGAGKSTTFNLLSGFLRLSSGEITFLDQNLESGSPWKVARRGLVRTFQHSSLLSELTVFDNIYVGTAKFLSSKTARIERVYETAEILGLDHILSEEAKSLPHGLQRMLGVAIAFASRPALLCLDEPLTGLNQTEAAEAIRLIRRLKDDKGTTILFVEHNMQAVVALCERIIVLNYGQLLASGKPEEISRNADVIEAYLGATS